MLAEPAELIRKAVTISPKTAEAGAAGGRIFTHESAEKYLGACASL